MKGSERLHIPFNLLLKNILLDKMAQILREDRDDRFEQLLTNLTDSLGGLTQTPSVPKSKLIPQVPPKVEREDLHEYF